MSKSFIRDYRGAVAKLKAKGLVSKSIDARSAQITPALTRAIKKHAGVLRGNEAVIALKRVKGATSKDLKELGYTITRPKGQAAKITVPHFRGEKVTVKGGLLEFRSDEGIRRLELPRAKDGESFDRYLHRLDKLDVPRPARGQSYGARFFDNRTRLYPTFQQLVNKVRTYESVRKAAGRKDNLELVRNFEIVTVRDRAAWQGAREGQRRGGRK